MTGQLRVYERSSAPAALESYPPRLIALEAEAAMLGALMIDNRGVFDVADIIDAADFYEPLHQRLFHQIVVTVDRGGVASPPTLAHLFRDDPAITVVGGVGYLATLTQHSGAVIAMRQFAEAIADLSKRRKLHAMSLDLVADAADLDLSNNDIVERADAAMMEALGKRTNTASRSIGAAWDQAIAGIDAERAGGQSRGITFRGFDDLNAIGLKCRPGHLVVVAGRPAMGKTAVGVKAACAAASNGHGVLFVSLEVPLEDIALRVIADRIYEPGNSPGFEKLQRGDLTAFDRRALAEAREGIADWPLQIVDPPTLRIAKLGMMIRRYQRRMAAKGQTLELVVLDYLGLVRGDPRKSKYEEVTEITQTLKVVAKETGVCIMALAQLSRAVEQREDKRPQLSDLRDSGSVEQDADAVAFIYREQYYLEQSEPDANSSDPKVVKQRETWENSMNGARDRVEIFTAKVRQAAKGRRKCYFFLDCQAVRGSGFYNERGL